jgi:8-hydroxy-5-deazaflavin:NADPH oxidoreductase
MTTVGLIGSGMIGGTVAMLAVAAGYQVVLSNSRGPRTLAGLVGELGPLARAATVAEAASAGDLVVVAIPLKAYGDVPAAELRGTIVMDTGNYAPARRDGQLAQLDSGALTSSELLQRQLTGAKVVKVFNNIYFKHLASLARPAGAADRSFLPVAADDQDARSAVTGFLDSIGYGAVDAGSLADSWRQQPGTPVYGTPYGSFSDEKGTPADAAVIRAALASATPASATPAS